jgi:mRNA interferase HigB
MRIIARNRLIAFWARHPTTEASLWHWHEAKSLDGERVRFEVAGGDYRMVVAFDWKRSIAFIKFVGTHADYDKIDALTVSLF